MSGEEASALLNTVEKPKKKKIQSIYRTSKFKQEELNIFTPKI